MYNKYPHLLSPLRIGNLVLKNRMTASPSMPHFVQGPEPYPSEAMITHFANKAKSGAAMVVCGSSLPSKKTSETIRWPYFEYENGPSQNYLCQLAEAIHFYDSKASMILQCPEREGYDVSAGIPSLAVEGDSCVSTYGKEMPVEIINDIAEEYAEQAFLFKKMGFDMAFIHSSYRFFLPSRFLSPLTNKRTDQYGGGVENRARFLLMVCERIKKRCGEDFPIEASISAYEPEGGNTLEETLAFAKMAEGYLDMIQIRAHAIDPTHPTGFNPEATPFLYLAEAFKESGTRVKVVTVGGYQDFDICEGAIASGKADLIAMARSWISNTDYGIKAYEGRKEDVVPCVRCNKCHVSSRADPWLSVCSVNPTWGIEHKVNYMVKPPTMKKKVAVIGGGPAGMEAALIASERGHDVTLFEKNGFLGGQLKHADFASFKWPYKDFKNYLVRQVVNKASIEVHLNTEITAERLKKDSYDAILVAIGSTPMVPQVPGTDGDNVMFAERVFGNEDCLSENTVIVGGGEVGVETGLHLAQTGLKVVLLEMLDELARDATPIHYRTMFREAWENEENFSYILNARCTGIDSDKVTYIDANGAEHKIKAGSVVLATGMKPKTDEALEYYGIAGRTYMIGDCHTVGNVQKSIRSAFSIASSV